MGNFFSDRKHGYGKLYINNNLIFEGDFKNDNFYRGIVYSSFGDIEFDGYYSKFLKDKNLNLLI